MLLTNLRLKIRNFWKKHKYKIVIGLFIWLIVIIINYTLKYNKTPILPSTSYEPHVSIMNTGEEVPNNLISPIEEWIDSFFKLCNNKEYETAYGMLSEEYKKENTLEEFKAYVDDVFNTQKIYVLQSYSNQKDIYIYQIKIMDDILSTGLTGQDELEYVDERIVIKRNGQDLQYSIGNKISEEELNKVFENEHMKITITKKETKYDEEIYTLKVENRTDYTIILNNIYSQNSVELDLVSDQRTPNGEVDMEVEPGGTSIFRLRFTKFFDDKKTARALKFNSVCVFEEYNGYETEDEALRKYSISIDL